jgi:cation transport regulator
LLNDYERRHALFDHADLPDSVREHLPAHAQNIYRRAFNSAFAAHASDPRQEEAAHRIAWASVKRSYVKSGTFWIAKGDAPWSEFRTSRSCGSIGTALFRTSRSLL